ncbi:MAG: threonine synthase [Bacteroidetes bacterium]|nr:threonine synthase [Bacteroidota bacterium]MDA1176927.1 threonine synthase [Bacteroidota bacterium]
MNYFSLNNNAPIATFETAVRKGLAPDKGLYFPEHIEPLQASFLNSIENYSDAEIAFQSIKQFICPEIPEYDLKQIISETLSFDFPIVEIEEGISTLELFHGPTMAFKDVGARFMARCLGYFNKDNNEEVTVLVATSGDTGGAVASGFLGVKGVRVVILYPSGKVSHVQEKQLTTLGQNITALEVDGTFDDCQDIVKRAFLDDDLTEKMALTSANSINIARWMPQMFYFLFSYKQLKSKNKPIVFSVPSGNFGNICAGMLAQKLGFPFAHFIASNNANNVVERYFKTNAYSPLPSIQTISNAMDVGNPSNFIRLQKLYDNDFEALKNNLTAYSFSDEQTKEALSEIYKGSGYIADPHGAVGYLGCKSYREKNPAAQTIFLETAHPTKFLDVVEALIPEKIALPSQIQAVIEKEKSAIFVEDYSQFKTFLLNF